MSLSPTITSPAMMTGVGVLLGTAAYMAPEQARGKEVDTRADIWAFGCVVYEMLTGVRPFEGDNVTDVLARVIERTPDLTRLPPATPRAVRTMLRRCLEKDRRRRLPDIVGARLDLDDASIEPPDNVQTLLSRSGRGQLFVWSVITVVVGLLAVIGTWLYRTPAPSEPVWLSILPPASGFGTSPAPAISRDGRRIAFAALDSAGVPMLWVRDLDSPVARLLPGTQDAEWRIRTVPGGRIRRTGQSPDHAKRRAWRDCAYVPALSSRRTTLSLPDPQRRRTHYRSVRWIN